MAFLTYMPASVLVILSMPDMLGAQASPAAPTRPALYSLYIARHEATIQFAALAQDKAADGGTRKLAELLKDEHTETAKKIRKLADKEGISLTPPSHDTTEALLRQARQQLDGKEGRAFDSTFALQAHGWLMTLMMDNGKNVLRTLPDGDLKKFGEAYGTFLFRELVEADKLKHKFQK